MKLETQLVHVGRPIEPGSHAITPSIVLATTFEREQDGTYEGDVYSRTSTPNRRNLETALAMLEGGRSAYAFSSGQAAASAVLQSLSAGDHVILPNDLYHGMRYLVTDILRRWGLQADFVDMRDPEHVSRAVKPNTRLIWVETPSNPSLQIADIAAIAQIAHQAGALYAVDNTWATPIWQKPLDLGADIVMHSTTKYLGGHSDVLGGALVLREPADGPLSQRLYTIQKLSGAVPSPFDCWLILRSLPTLALRVRAQTASAGKIAAVLNTHPRIERVNYPGLSTHPGHAVATRQMRGFGAMLSFEIRGGQAEALAVAAKTAIFARATSLGGVESLIEHRASVEGPATVTPSNLLRVSVGLEHPDDLTADLLTALES
ncbi:MAG: aminotransferase class V-fold PLP-dependent enzyme [Chloroflexi bacterium]|nr:aminotransferase class V-fold PLP-dependent enzyme [Chloroflexota bacterium]